MSALQAAVKLLGPRLGRLTLATVIPYDCGVDRQRTARSTLEEQAELLGGEPRLELLHGRPAPILLERAVSDGYDLLVLGTRGAGLTKALLGSTAVDVAEGATIPVLLMDNGDRVADGVMSALSHVGAAPPHASLVPNAQ